MNSAVPTSSNLLILGLELRSGRRCEEVLVAPVAIGSPLQPANRALPAGKHTRTWVRFDEFEKCNNLEFAPEEVALLLCPRPICPVAPKVFEKRVVAFEACSIGLPKPGETDLWDPRSTRKSKADRSEDAIYDCIGWFDYETIDGILHRLESKLEDLVCEEAKDVASAAALLGRREEVDLRANTHTGDECIVT